MFDRSHSIIMKIRDKMLKNPNRIPGKNVYIFRAIDELVALDYVVLK